MYKNLRGVIFSSDLESDRMCVAQRDVCSSCRDVCSSCRDVCSSLEGCVAHLIFYYRKSYTISTKTAYNRVQNWEKQTTQH